MTIMVARAMLFGDPTYTHYYRNKIEGSYLILVLGVAANLI
jgi:hypothetical protein